MKHATGSDAFATRLGRQGTRRSFRENLERLMQLSGALSDAARALEYPDMPAIDRVVDFYEEVRRFEIALIGNALNQTGGSQIKAASLLKMKHTTLNNKIKQYNIR